MRVCIISGYPPNIGRGAESTYMLVQALNNCTEISHLEVLANIAAKSSFKEKADKVTVLRLWMPNSFKSIKNLLPNIADFNPHIVHMIYGYLYYGKPVYSAFFVVFTLMLLRFLRKTVVVTIHQIFSLREVTEDFLKMFTKGLPLSLIRIGFSLLNKTIGCFSSKVVVVHRRHKQILEREYGLGNVVYIPIGLLKSQLVSKEDAKLSLGVDGKTVLLVFGFIVPYKGVEYAIKALPEIMEKLPDSVLIIAGTLTPSSASLREAREYVEYLKRLIKKLSLGSYIRFRNEYIPNEAVTSHFAASDVVILPNLEQSGPSEVWRVATLCGVPAVATDIGYFKEDIVHGETGLLVSAKDSESLADSVIRLFEDSVLRDKIQRNIKALASDYDVENVALKHVKLYKALMSKKMNCARVFERI